MPCEPAAVPAAVNPGETAHEPLTCYLTAPSGREGGGGVSQKTCHPTTDCETVSPPRELGRADKTASSKPRPMPHSAYLWTTRYRANHNRVTDLSNHRAHAYGSMWCVVACYCATEPVT